MKMVCDYLYGWIKQKRWHMQKSRQEMVNPRDLAGNTEEEEDSPMIRYPIPIQSGIQEESTKHGCVIEIICTTPAFNPHTLSLWQTFNSMTTCCIIEVYVLASDVSIIGPIYHELCLPKLPTYTWRQSNNKKIDSIHWCCEVTSGRIQSISIIVIDCTICKNLTTRNIMRILI